MPKPSRTSRRITLPSGRSFHLLLLGLAISSCGDWLYNVALLAVVYQRTGSATWVALTTAGRVVPIVILGPLGGVIADRYDRRRLIVCSDLARATLMVALAGVAADGLPVLLAPVLAGCATAAGTVHLPSVAASTARLVDVTELQRASAIRATIGQAAIVAGPALGALVLAVSSPAEAILLNAFSFLASAAATSAIPGGPQFLPARHEVTRSLLDEVRTGARALRGAPAAMRLVAADVLCSAVYGLLTVTLVLVGLRLGAGGGYGLLLGAFGLGGVAGATIAGRLDAPERWRSRLAIALAIVAISLAALGFVDAISLAIVCAFAAGAGAVVPEVLSDTALPQLLDDRVLARAYGLVLPISFGGIVAGSLIAAPLISFVGLTAALTAAGVSTLLTAGLLLCHPLSGPAPLAVPTASH